MVIYIYLFLKAGSASQAQLGEGGVLTRSNNWGAGGMCAVCVLGGGVDLCPARVSLLPRVPAEPRYRG